MCVVQGEALGFQVSQSRTEVAACPTQMVVAWGRSFDADLSLVLLTPSQSWWQPLPTVACFPDLCQGQGPA